MKSALAILALVSASAATFAESSGAYRAKRAFEAGEDSESRQINAIRECAVSKINTCVYPLIAHLKKAGKENAVLRRESANALGHLKAPEARDALVAMLAKEDDLFVKSAAIRALGSIGNKADVKTISPYLNDQEALLRRQAARALFDIDDKSASAEAAGRIANEKDDYTRVELLNTALQHAGGNVEYAIQLSKILTSPDRAARLRAAEVLGEYKNKETLGDLERAIQVEPDLQVRAAMHQAIGAVRMGN